ncbi:MAG: NAD(P)(+) transhydrogenase (Re/Si-specific) subunit beta [bacterium]|uniref:NAD(P) transhydrogenase subunit beta n=1 Tax=Candidatus Methylomirabilis tolerans TaxID=3123416 RepID=A0AAJ1EJL7_9BACT|nr:NAD(P)(+) transhydrogenase (Re/Si-specific) subunit beta [Candidatus Methylomirabilis sp.]
MIIEVLYLAATVLFIVGLKMMSGVPTAKTGNLLSAVGMGLAILATLMRGGEFTWTQIIAGIVVGSVIGVVSATKVQMTAMPQMVALFNGVGGGASQLVAIAELYRSGSELPLIALIAVQLSVFVGALTFSGSVVAFAKLQELMPGRPILFTGQHWINVLLLLGAILLGGWVTVDPGAWGPFILLNLVGLVLGILVVIPIGGADMPVVISLLNSYSGVAGATTGFVLFNNALIITGSLVGASGIILTNIMCKGMNRSLTNVLFGGFGAVSTAGSTTISATGAVSEGTIDDAVTVLQNAQQVIIVPGYGMAVSQAQHALREVGDLLSSDGATVKYAIHPVAGRMPGHMNVLLAEANVSYDQICDLEDINDEFSKTDAVIVVGANDVVNPGAKTNPSSPIYGMPILNVDEARTVIVLKRSMSPGFAGIDNELFVLPNTMMVFGDAKQTLTKMVQGLKN